MHNFSNFKVLIVSNSDNSGGASKAAFRLHKAFIKSNINSYMIVQKKISDNAYVVAPDKYFQKALSIFRPVIERLVTKFFYRKKSLSLFSIGWVSSRWFVRKINQLNPDIVNLHWVNGGMLRIEDIKKIKAPIIWSLQDMWPFTGGCHFNEGCFGYEINCGNCKVLSSKHEHDLSRLIFNRKKRNFIEIENIVLNGVSNWIAGSAKNSSLFKTREVVNVPNLIDTNLFKPISKALARDIFNIPKNKKVVLFGASSISDSRKGYSFLLSVLSEVEDLDVVFVVAGQSEPIKKLDLRIPVYYLPPVHDDSSLMLIYNCADLVIVPSIEENLSNMIIESLSCGVPVVAFNIGGNSDMIDHKKNGYLVKAYDKKDMLYGIRWVINENIIDLSGNSRKKIQDFFSEDVIVEKYLDLFKGLLKS